MYCTVGPCWLSSLYIVVRLLIPSSCLTPSLYVPHYVSVVCFQYLHVFSFLTQNYIQDRKKEGSRNKQRRRNTRILITVSIYLPGTIRIRSYMSCTRITNTIQASTILPVVIIPCTDLHKARSQWHNSFFEFNNKQQISHLGRQRKNSLSKHTKNRKTKMSQLT